MEDTVLEVLLQGILAPLVVVTWIVEVEEKIIIEDVIIMQILIETLRLQEDLDLLDEVDPDRVIASLIVDHDVITVTTAIEMLLQSSV